MRGRRRESEPGGQAPLMPTFSPHAGRRRSKPPLNVPSVMAGPVPAIHVFVARGSEDVDARHEAGHDDSRATLARPERHSGWA